MDDSAYGLATLVLPKDSEFFQLKGGENEFFNRLHSLELLHQTFHQRKYEMVEPRPLGFNYVMFLSLF